MAEHHQHHYGYSYTTKSTHHFQQQDHHEHSTSSKLLTIIALFPIGGACFLLSGLILTGSIIGLTIATPLFLFFSPILVPAMLIIALAVTGFLTAGVFGITGFSSLARIARYLRQMRGGDHQLDLYAKKRKRRAQEARHDVEDSGVFVHRV